MSPWIQGVWVLLQALLCADLADIVGCKRGEKGEEEDKPEVLGGMPLKHQMVPPLRRTGQQV